MRISKMKDMRGGWFVGNFDPASFKTDLFEVCYKNHVKGEKWDIHIHKVATEINYLIRGKMKIQDTILEAGDIFILNPFEVADPEFLEDCELIIIKTPSVPGDKYPATATNTMRIAVCMSGLPRDIAEIWKPFQENLLSRLPNADLFIYSGEHSDAFAKLNPKKVLIEPQVRHPDLESKIRTYYHSPDNTNPYVQQVYGLKKVWELKEQYEREQGFKYDIVVRTRPDLLWLQPVTIDMIDTTKLTTLHKFGPPLLACEFAIGPDKEMEKYMHIYDWLLEYGDKYDKRHPILNHKPDRGYCSDTYLTIYLQEYLKMQLSEPKIARDARYWPYNYYRVMAIHRRGAYDSDPLADRRFDVNRWKW